MYSLNLTPTCIFELTFFTAIVYFMIFKEKLIILHR